MGELLLHIKVEKRHVLEHHRFVTKHNQGARHVYRRVYHSYLLFGRR